MTTTRRGTRIDGAAAADASSSPSASGANDRARSTSPSKTKARRARPATAVAAPARNPPYLPTPIEGAWLAIFPLMLWFGTVFSIISPETRASPYDPVAQSHHQDPSVAPSYFARKSNVFNVYFVKLGWAWVSAAFALFLFTHPSMAAAAANAPEGGAGFLSARRLRGALRWGAVTAWWFLVTQWCFGPPIIDRGFRWTGGKCELAEAEIAMGDTSLGEQVTAVACKAVGGKWKGGHDISGHVFLLVLGMGFLMSEVGWSIRRWANAAAGAEERSVVMPDGALKGAGVESDRVIGEGRGNWSLGAGGKLVFGVMGMSLWMLLMTVCYFHTWFEKITGLLSAAIALYVVYIVPRFAPGLRSVLGLPGI